MTVFRISNLKKTWYYLQKNGVKAAYLAALERLEEAKRTPYSYSAPSGEVLSGQREDTEKNVRISVIVPSYETKKEHLTQMLDSLMEQTYPHWELVLADASAGGRVKEALTAWEKEHKAVLVKEASAEDRWQDRSIRYKRLAANGGIAENTNAGISLAAGDYTGLLDHDDLLTPDALYEMASAIESGKKRGAQPQVLYSDEDKCDGEAAFFYEPHFKPDFDQELLLSNNYICHFMLMDTGLIQKLKLRPGFDGAQDYDLVLRAVALGISFTHVPKVLYHWRCHGASTAANPRSKTYAYEAGKRAVEDFCKTAGWKVKVSHLKHLGFYRVDYEESLFAQRPEVGICAGPLPGGRRFSSGIYQKDGSMLYAGLRRGFSGPMHRAALQQSADAVDLRAMSVCPKLRQRYENTMERLQQDGAREADYCRESILFCEKARKEGYRILWDPLEKSV